MSDTYVCAMCHETFNKGRSDEEAMAEANELFGNVAMEECEVVCDECWKRLPCANPCHDDPPQWFLDLFAETLKKQLLAAETAGLIKRINGEVKA